MANETFARMSPLMQNVIAGVLIMGIGAGAGGLAIAYTNQRAVAGLQEDAKQQNTDSQKSREKIIKIENDVEHVKEDVQEIKKHLEKQQDILERIDRKLPE